MGRDSERSSGQHRDLPGTHRGPRPERHPDRHRVTAVVRAFGLLAAGGLATGFGYAFPAADHEDHPTATGVLDAAPGTVTRDSLPAGPEATDLPGPTTASPEPQRRRDARERRQRRTVPADGPGTFRTADRIDRPETPAYGELTYTVEVEDGLGFDPRRTGERVERVLEHPRSWQDLLGQPLRRTTGTPDFRVLLATPGTTDALCAPLQTLGEVSCRNGDLVVLNAERWAEGVPDYAGALQQYRTYLVNHEVGHRLGQSHVECPAAGTPAPVMQQQTYGLDGCTRNAWPAATGQTG